MSVREIVGHLRELYGVDISPDLISAVTDAVLDEIAAWQGRPLEPVYPLIFFDALRIKVRDEGVVRNKAVHIAPIAIRNGSRPAILWACAPTAPRKCSACGWSRTRARSMPSGLTRGFWLRVMNELKNRGVEDVLLAVAAQLAQAA